MKYTVPVWRISHWALDPITGSMLYQNGLPYAQPGVYNANLQLDPAKTCIIVMDPWRDMLDGKRYDDADLTYTGYTATASTGPFLGTFHYSTVVGSQTEFAFDGSRITLYYSKYSNRGSIAIYVDDVLVDTLDQYGATRVWQCTWTSGDLGPGRHTVRLVHASGAVVDIDAIDVADGVSLNSYFGEIVDNKIAPLVDAAYARGIPVVVLTNNPGLYTYNTKIAASLEQRVAQGKAIVKYHDSYNEATFASYLAGRSIDTLIYVGSASNACIIGRKDGMYAQQNQGLKVYFIPEASAAMEDGNPSTWQEQTVRKEMTHVISTQFWIMPYDGLLSAIQ